MVWGLVHSFYILVHQSYHLLLNFDISVVEKVGIIIESLSVCLSIGCGDIYEWFGGSY